MSDDFLSTMSDAMLADPGSPDAAPPVEAPAPESAQAEAAQLREPEPEAPQGGHIPIQALLDEREKRQEAQRRADDLQRQMQQLQAQQNRAPEPDLYDDPEAYAARMDQKLAQTEWTMRRNMSANFAISAHGQDKLDAAVKWADEKADPFVQQRFTAAPDPYGLLIKEYERDQLMSQIGTDPDAYVRRRFAELSGGSAQQPAAPAAIPQPAASPAPPRSLARVSGSGGATHIPPDAPWEGLTFNLDKPWPKSS